MAAINRSIEEDANDMYLHQDGAKSEAINRQSLLEKHNESISKTEVADADKSEVPEVENVPYLS